MRAVAGLLLLFALSLPASAEERITSYHSDISLEKTGVMMVTETIAVIADGSQIKHGIFRDFPLTFEGNDGKFHRVDFQIKAIRRDGNEEPYHTASIDHGIRIYIGSADVYLNGGPHVFEITYQTGRQIRYFPDHDELFWNVTGNEWRFPIDMASATVTLPGFTKPEALTWFTGPRGATLKNATASDVAGKINFVTTLPLNLHDGLTIGIKLAKGAIDPPSTFDNIWWWIHDYTNSVLAGLSLLAVLLFFSVNWLRYGRDPSRGVIVPRWDAPEDISPALVNYIANKGFSNGGWTAFSASAIDLAVKGYITLQDLKKSVSLMRTQTPPTAPLPTGEDVIYGQLEKTQASLTINAANGKTVQTLGEKFRGAIDKEHSGKYYRFNVGTRVLGMLLAIVGFVGTILLGNFTADMIGMLIMPAVIFLFVSVFSAILGITVFSSPVMALRIVAGFFLAVFWLCFILVLATFAWQFMGQIQSDDDQFAFIALLSMVVLTAFFMVIMGAATPLGREMMDGIEGLRRYLTVAEKDRMNFAGAPQMSPQHFEKLLPFAVALGVEKPWSSAFQTWLDAAGSAMNYQPVWYMGNDFDSRHFGDQMSSFSSSLSSTISASLPAPPSSSSSGFSSGGGSSGGGGGGGGGGGW
jgi:uncharacterized membrane protein YgcG